MRLLSGLLVLISIFFLSACGGSDTTNTNAPTGSDTTGTPTEMEANQATPRANHDCKIKGKILEGNQFWIKEQEVLVCIVADSTTVDKDLGDSHRIVEAYDTKTCERIFRKALPINVSADFPYYLAEITYNNVNQMVAIRGFNTLYCFNVADKTLSPAMKPNFKTMRFPVDAQTGMIKHLEVWENYLAGFAQDQGVFVFDLSNRAQPKPVLPFAEYKLEENDFASLFLLTSGKGQQAIVPTYDLEKSQFSVNALLEEPTELSRGVMETAKNNRYLVLRPLDSTAPAIGVDMAKRKRVALPADKATAKTQEIVAWMKAQE
ncbi:MAG: hypothetical protein HUU01_11910 [Saprospiraceae bacterium]|nr:hypothetical protein [Saprospiraceae bacterium]